MKTRRSFLTACLGVSCLVATSGVTSPVGAGVAKTRLAIVVSKDSPVSDISFYELKRLYLGEKINASGKRLLPLNLTPNFPERGAFDRTVLGMSPEAIARYWVDRKIRGDSGPCTASTAKPRCTSRTSTPSGAAASRRRATSAVLAALGIRKTRSSSCR